MLIPPDWTVAAEAFVGDHVVRLHRDLTYARAGFISISHADGNSRTDQTIADPDVARLVFAAVVAQLMVRRLS